MSIKIGQKNTVAATKITAAEIAGITNNTIGKKSILQTKGRSISFFLKLNSIAIRFIIKNGANIRISVKTDSFPESDENAAIVKEKK
ncbi:MAG: hypothetical protein ACQEUD_15100 [Bacillota bacterium]